MSAKNNRADKHNQFAQKNENHKPGARNLLVGVVIMLAMAVAGGYALMSIGDSQVMVEAYAPQQGDKVIKIDAAAFDDGKARYYKFPAGNMEIAFFAVKSKDGKLRTAFDACDVCWPAGKGYKQSGDHMICNNCGRRFVTHQVGDVSGGCNPAPLPSRVVDGELRIRVTDIMQGVRYFDFSS